MKTIIKFTLLAYLFCACTTNNKEISGRWKLVSGVDETTGRYNEEEFFDSTFLFLLNFKSDQKFEMYNEETNDFVQLDWSFKNDSVLTLSNHTPSPFYYYYPSEEKNEHESIVTFKNDLMEIKTIYKNEDFVCRQKLLFERVEDQFSYIPLLREKISAENTSQSYAYMAGSLEVRLEKLGEKYHDERTLQILKITDDILKKIRKIKRKIIMNTGGGLRVADGSLLRPFMTFRKERFNVDLNSVVKSYEKLVSMKNSKYKKEFDQKYLIDSFSYIGTIPTSFHKQFGIQVSESISGIEAMNNLYLYEIHCINLSISLIVE